MVVFELDVADKVDAGETDLVDAGVDIRRWQRHFSQNCRLQCAPLDDLKKNNQVW